MLFRRLWICIPLLWLGGCTYFPYVVRNVGSSATNFVHDCKFQHQATRLAEEAWRETVGCLSNQDFSETYARGFREGFVDYLDSNGPGEPPAVPPRDLRCSVLRTPEEQEKIADWFAGFRHGASCASQKQYRDRIVVPISQPPRNVGLDLNTNPSVSFPETVSGPFPQMTEGEKSKSR